MITSVRNRQIVAAARLKKRGIREQHGRFLVEGALPAAEALDAGAVQILFHVPGAAGRVGELVRRAGELGVEPVAVSEPVMAHLTSTVTPQPVVAVASFIDVPVSQLRPGVVPILCEVRDPGNAGTIVRAADASGAAGVVFTDASVDPYNPKTVRSSAGSLFHVPIVRESPAPDAVSALRASGCRVVAAAADGRSSVYDTDLTGPIAVLFGNEARGLPPALRDLADESVRVPTEGRAESLNLAAAAALVLFEAARQRGRAGRGGLAGDIVAAAHDLRLPLVGIRGFAATLSDRWEDVAEEGRREAVSLMAYDAERGAALLELVVALARAEAGQATGGDGPADLAEIGRGISAAFGRNGEGPDVRWVAGGTVPLDERIAHALLFVALDVVSSLAATGGLVVTRAGSDAEASIEISVPGVREETGSIVQQGALRLARRVAEASGAALETGPGTVRLRVLPDA